jgi:putative acetyltransferase
VKITHSDLGHEKVTALLREHLDAMHRHSPPGKVHALDLDSLRADCISFFTAWERDELLGCGALKELDPTHAEIKSMHTARPHHGKGIASAILQHMLTISRARSYRRISLETGSGAAFVPAQRLYEKFGFSFCAAFGDYREDSFSRFMRLDL